MIKLRVIDLEKDYSLIASWWQGHEFPAPAQGLLPPVGVMAEHNGVPVAASFLYEAKDCLVSFIEWTITDPEELHLLTAKAVALLIEFLANDSASRGRPILVSSAAEGTGMQKLLRRLGWEDTQGKPHRILMTVVKEPVFEGGKR